MTILLGVLCLGFLVFFHELGHFSAARLFGVTVEAFSVGMGPVLLHRTVGKTDYRLSLIPLGGYCAMKGEHDYQDALEKELPEIQGEADSFYGVHPLKRLLIAFAGPFFNIVFGFILFFVVALMGYTYQSAGTTVSMADELYEDMSSPAHRAGMQTGDRIIAVNGLAVDDFDAIVGAVSVHADEDITITVERDGVEKSFTVRTELDKETGAGKVGIVANMDSVVERNYGPYSFFPALAEGGRQTVRFISLTFKSIALLFKGVDVTNAVVGPARMTTMVGSTVQEGFSAGAHIGIVSTFQLLALISISLFITNMLPVPVLDGGLILFACVEWVARRKMPPKLLYYIQLAGIVIITALFVLAVAGDLRYFFFK
ncbi:MAG TPA: peptidase [Treponema sp.]|nr:peptidase [Treponema sp.]